MLSSIIPLRRVVFCLVGLLFVIGLIPSPRPASAAFNSGPESQEESGFRLNYLPAQMRQLCQGDSTTFTVWAHWYEPPDDSDLPLAPLVPPGDADQVDVAPLTVRHVQISAVNGKVSPSDFLLLSSSQYMQFTYTAEGEGLDTITAVIDDGGAKAEKQISVLPACEYDISFLVVSQENTEAGGFGVVFKGDGDFFVDRTAESVGELTGDGQDDLAWLMWAAAPEAFSCTMDKVTASSRFNIEGMLNAEPYNFLHVNIRFPEPLQLPSSLHWSCNAAGLSNVEVNIPLPPESRSSDPSTMDMVGLTYPLEGGVVELQVPKGFGYIVVTQR